MTSLGLFLGFPDGSDGKESACIAGDLGLIPGSGRPPGEREWQLTPVFLPGEFHGQRSMAGYSRWGRKESDTTERLTLSLFLFKTILIIVEFTFQSFLFSSFPSPLLFLFLSPINIGF